MFLYFFINVDQNPFLKRIPATIHQNQATSHPKRIDFDAENISKYDISQEQEENQNKEGCER